MGTTIYFSGSISAGREDAELYRRIVAALRQAGHRVIDGEVTAELATHASQPAAQPSELTAHRSGGFDPRPIFARDMGWLGEAALLVAEVSKPSTGVGYEIAAARYLRRIPVIALWRPAWTPRCSAMISGDPAITLIEYAESDWDSMTERLLAAVAAAEKHHQSSNQSSDVSPALSS